MFLFSTEHLNRVFAEEDKLTSFKNLIFDLNRGNKIMDYDVKGNPIEISKAEANKKVQKVIFEILGLDENSAKSKKARRRAFDAHWVELFEVIEEEIEFKIQEGFMESEWFNACVDYRNNALGDENEFWIEDKSYLVVGEVAGSHHDIAMQTVASGTSVRVPTSTYAIKVGYDIDLISTGRIDFSKLTTKVAEAFLNKVQAMTYDEIITADDELPSQFKKTGSLGSATKDTFDGLISDVSIANGSEVVIMGTKNALKKITALTDSDIYSDAKKNEINELGRLASYEGTEIIELPQRFKVGDTGTKLVTDSKLLIIPKNAEKFVKFFDIGEVETREISEKGGTKDDFQSYELQREMGVGTVLGQYFGSWTLA